MAQIDAVLGDWLGRRNEADPPVFDVPWMLANFRHACPEARISRSTGKPASTALDCAEKYVTLTQVLTEMPYPGAELDHLAPEGDRWAIVYREGRCARCGALGRSKVGHVVSTADRPPLEGRVAR